MGNIKAVSGTPIVGSTFTLVTSSIGYQTEDAFNRKKVKSVITYDNIQLAISLDKRTYRLGESAVVMLTVTNKSSNPLCFNFSSTRQYDFVVTREGEEIWQ